MANSISYWINQINLQKAAQGLPLNTNINSTWSKLSYIWATIANQLESNWDLFRQDLNSIANQSAYGSSNWLKSKIFQFQYDSVTPQVVSFDPATLKFGYAEPDSTKQIIKQAAIKRSNNRTVLAKVAKESGTNLVGLSNIEQLAFKSYLDQITPAGQNVIVISVDGDDILVSGTVTYIGQYIQSNIQTETETAIKNTIQSIDFGGILYESSLVQSVKSVTGVIDFVISSIAVSDARDSWAVPVLLNPAVGSLELYAGYARNISFNITYQAQ